MPSFLNALGRPAVEIDWSRVRPYEDNTAEASLREGFRLTSLHAINTEYRVSRLVNEEIDESPDYTATSEARRPAAAEMYYPGGAADREALREDVLPKYTDRAEIEAEFIRRGKTLDPDLPIDQDGVTIPRLLIYQENLEAKKRDDAIMANAKPGLATMAKQLGGGLIGSLADPINFVPLAGGLNRARTLVRGTRVLSRAGLATLGKSAAIGAAEGAAGALAADAVAAPMANRWGAGYTWQDVAGDVLAGAALGGPLSVLGTALGPRRLAGLHQDALVKATADIEAGRPVDVSPILEARTNTIEDVFGQEFPDFKGQAGNAVEHLLVEQRGYVPGALYREELGDIDLPWGKGGEKGFGLAHIIERRNSSGYDGEAFARSLPRIVQEGRVEQRAEYPGRAYIVHDEAEAVVRLEWDGQKRTWLLTTYPWTKENAPKPRLDFKPNDRAHGDGQHLPPSHSEGVDTNIDELFAEDNTFSQAPSRGQRTSFETAGPTADAADAQAWRDSREAAPASGSQAREALDIINEESANELIAAGLVDRSLIDELDAATRDLNDTKRRRVALAEATRCVLENGI